MGRYCSYLLPKQTRGNYPNSYLRNLANDRPPRSVQMCGFNRPSSVRFLRFCLSLLSQQEFPRVYDRHDVRVHVELWRGGWRHTDAVAEDAEAWLPGRQHPRAALQRRHLFPLLPILLLQVRVQGQHEARREREAGERHVRFQLLHEWLRRTRCVLMYYREVHLHFTPEMEVLRTLFERSHTEKVRDISNST